MGKYDGLKEHLLKDGSKFVRMSISDIELVLGGSLPMSASEHSSWWGNDYAHVQAKAWLDAGYAVSSPDYVKQTGIVDFVKAEISVVNGIVYINAENA